ncbi:DUF2573 family protein [Paenibacillus agricola]|uniref:DUF2573 family protein n=1 Tax=Paenibacillus agricola TaxID=2716264 RepID=A0ABX0J855_9BACL|nr:DUF2573 family protein [Paenibacillus agricola]NHN30279.1 DUF2573 family protein [Paenibacillus agricola]
MNEQFDIEFEALLETFSAMLTGSQTPEMVEKIKIWSIYNHIHKTMPALASHWNQEHPESRAIIRGLFQEVRAMHLELKEKNLNGDE